jgi:hypothetical protein
VPWHWALMRPGRGRAQGPVAASAAPPLRWVVARSQAVRLRRHERRATQTAVRRRSKGEGGLAWEEHPAAAKLLEWLAIRSAMAGA